MPTNGVVFSANTVYGGRNHIGDKFARDNFGPIDSVVFNVDGMELDCGIVSYVGFCHNSHQVH